MVNTVQYSGAISKLANTIFNHRFVRYSLVGVLSVLLYYISLVFLVEVMKVSPTLASAYAVGFILITAYILNYYWTFQSKSRHAYVIPRFIFTSLLGLVLNSGIMFVSVEILGLWYLVGASIGTIIVPVNNFLLNSNWSFAELDRKSGEDNI
jgi:putative flippase GtrA